jgi:hypothetical protein
MSKIKYVDAPSDIAEAIEVAVPIKDFLPSPSEIARNTSKEKIVLNLEPQAKSA